MRATVNRSRLVPGLSREKPNEDPLRALGFAG